MFLNKNHPRQTPAFQESDLKADGMNWATMGQRLRFKKVPGDSAPFHYAETEVSELVAVI